MRFALRPATEADIEFLVALRRETMYRHLENAGVALDESAQLARVRYRFECAQIVSVDGADAGLLKVDRAGSPWQLIQIQIAREFRGQGLGEALIRDVLAEADAAGTAVELHVLKSNPAKALYERLGFRTLGAEGPEYLMRYGH